MESDSNYEPDREESGNEETVSKKYKCRIQGCNAVFAKRHRLKEHSNLHKNMRLYKCTHEGCDKAYTCSSHLKRHLQTHDIVAKGYKCHLCSASISTPCNLKRHYKRAHNSEKELCCQECNLTFRKKYRYEEHMAAHKNSLLYKCEKCGKIFLTHAKLQKHQLSHKKKSYQCPIDNCKEVFEKWAMLLKHKNTQHTIEYSCTVCDKVFLYKHLLKQHGKTHAENRPAIPCPYEQCSRLYYFKRNLDQHIRTKHMGNKFHCDICNIKLATKQKIKEHIEKKHMSKTKHYRRKTSRPRKDIGVPKKSLLSQLTGVNLSVKIEKQLINRDSIALLRDRKVEDSSYSEDDRVSDVSAKGA